MRSSPLVAALVLSLAACGDDGGGSTPDAQEELDAPIDAPTVIPGCDYVEQHDSTNDDFEGGMPEDSGLTFAGETVLCGRVDPGHFEAGGSAGEPGIPDIDSFVVTLSAPSDVLVRLSGPGIATLGRAEVNVYSGPLFQNFEVSGDYEGDHAAANLSLPAGRFEFSIITENPTAITTAIDYKIKISSDTPLSRCPKITTAANYTESQDTGTNRGNDVVRIDYSEAIQQTLTAETGDAPEPSGITVAPATNHRISGSSAVIVPDAQYKDRDTFAFATGANTNELSVRLNWADAVDLDWYVFEANTLPGYVARQTTTVNTEFEFRTFALKPNTTYWLWVGGDSGNTTVAATPYDLSICGAQYVP